MTKYLKKLIELKNSHNFNVESFNEIYTQASEEDNKKIPFAIAFIGCDQICSACVFMSPDEMKRTPCIIGDLAFSLKEMKNCDDNQYEAFRLLKLIQFQAALEIYESNHSFGRI